MEILQLFLAFKSRDSLSDTTILVILVKILGYAYLSLSNPYTINTTNYC